MGQTTKLYKPHSPFLRAVIEIGFIIDGQVDNQCPEVQRSSIFSHDVVNHQRVIADDRISSRQDIDGDLSISSAMESSPFCTWTTRFLLLASSLA